MATSTKKSTAAAKSVKPATSAAKTDVKASPSKSVAKAAPAKSPAKPSKAEAKPATKGTPTKTAPTKASPKAPQAPKTAVATKATTAKAAAAPKAAPAGSKAPASKTPPTTPTAAGAPPVVPGKPAAPRLTVRTPIGADELKQKIGALATATGQIRALKRTLQKSFYDIGLILKDIEDRKLYEVKGYGSFEAFLEREIELGKHLGLKLARAVQLFQREAAIQGGLERVSAAIAVFDGEVDPSAAATSSPTSSGGARSPIPFHKQ